MIILVSILSFLLIAYCISVFVLFIQLVGKKKLSWLIVTIEFISVGFFLFMKYLVIKGKIDFVNSYSNNDSWEAGMANAMAVTYNLLILIIVFVLSQLIIGTIFSKKFKELNR